MTQIYASKLKSIPLIKSAEEILLTLETKKKLGAKLTRVAERNAKRVTVYRIIYRSGGHDVKGYIVESKGGGKKPCVIWNRGGTGSYGALKIGELFVDLAKYANWGYLVIASEYSGNAGSSGKDEYGGEEVKDVLNLHKILKAYSKADEKRVGMVGRSRGGMMTYLCLTKAKWIKAAISVAGLGDLVRNAKMRPEMQNVFKRAFGGSKAKKIKRSAVFWPEKFTKNTPLLLLHGFADEKVSPLDSIDLSEGLYKHKVPHRLVVFENADHSLTGFEDEADKMIHDWLDKHLE